MRTLIPFVAAFTVVTVALTYAFWEQGQIAMSVARIVLHIHSLIGA